ncbi:membrane protein [Anoxybacillus gonensis]|uniref:Uncharacterized protein n=1 Tax=Anoxybacillus gonensis TaxID=198467 RepID=A0AAW7TE96_9BACL|nr:MULTISPECIES: hypothetical protein [Anoxybacillus]AXM89995.1 hypothetical protein B379_13020 [Anoxybacillus ayderensis G10]THD17356.1 hypothetical protein CI793_03075 [Anoxybacillus ayderensis]AKS38755.1 membrane protein [Anoxybacillus gonensis]KGP60134.1 membrane protein [Anoxybacillus gonensis]MBW9218091.1 hypothetical protein [Anoxybacillus sp. ST70]
MSFRFFFGLLFIFVFGRMVEYYVETYILHPILQSAVLAIFVAVVFILSGKVGKRYDLLDKKVKMHVWLPSLIGALCLAVFLYEIGTLPGK